MSGRRRASSTTPPRRRSGSWPTRRPRQRRERFAWQWSICPSRHPRRNGERKEGTRLMGTRKLSLPPYDRSRSLVDWVTSVFKAISDWAALVDADLVTAGEFGEKCELLRLSEELTISAAASTDTTLQIPANAILVAAPVYVTEGIPGPSTFLVSGASSGDLFCTAAISVAAGSSDKGTKAGFFLNTTAPSVRITPDRTPDNAHGKVRVTVFYWPITAPSHT